MCPFEVELIFSGASASTTIVIQYLWGFPTSILEKWAGMTGSGRNPKNSELHGTMVHG